jgi:hypothetical protein
MWPTSAARASCQPHLGSGSLAIAEVQLEIVDLVLSAPAQLEDARLRLAEALLSVATDGSNSAYIAENGSAGASVGCTRQALSCLTRAGAEIGKNAEPSVGSTPEPLYCLSQGGGSTPSLCCQRTSGYCDRIGATDARGSGQV